MNDNVCHGRAPGGAVLPEKAGFFAIMKKKLDFWP
jgi:hypothetical protein